MNDNDLHQQIINNERITLRLDEIYSTDLRQRIVAQQHFSIMAGVIAPAFLPFPERDETGL